MSEFKGLDQIFPKKADDEPSRGNFKFWLLAGIVAAFAAGYAFVPAATAVNPALETSSIAAPQAPSEHASAHESSMLKAEAPPPAVDAEPPPPPAIFPSATKPAPEVRAAVKAIRGNACDCETAELRLPSICPDASCRQCKASCGIPGN